MAKMYCQWVGIVLLVLGILGFLSPNFLGLPLTSMSNVIHLLSGGVLAYLGFTGTSVKTGAQIFGIVYALVGVLGFVAAGLLASLGVSVTPFYNLVHLILGALGLWAGFGQSEMVKA